MEALQAMQRERKEKDALIFKHLEELKQLKLRQDIEDYRDLKTGKSSNLRDEYN